MFYFDEWGVRFEALKQDSYAEPLKTSFIDFLDSDEKIGLREKQCAQAPIYEF